MTANFSVRQQKINTYQLWLDMQQPLHQFISKRVTDKTVADDILHDVFIKMEQNIKHVKDEEKITAWLYQITRNVITDYYRQQQKNMRLEQALSQQITPSKHVTNGKFGEAYTENYTEHFAQCIHAMIEFLPEKYRTALYLTEIEGISQKELAKRLGISYSGAKSRVQRGREQLKDAFLACCVIETDVYGNIVDYQRKCACTDEV